MYNLLVSGIDDRWESNVAELPSERCINSGEFTEESLAQRYGDVSGASLEELLQFPAVFAYESGIEKDARLGRIISAQKRPGAIRLKYEFDASFPSIKRSHLDALSLELDIQDWEMNRTHWAVKNEDLSAILQTIGYPPIGGTAGPSVDITRHQFSVALSFPGEVREYVQQVAGSLASSLGRDAVFYDKYYQAQLARPNLDTVLQKIYREKSDLIVAFLSGHYATKKWCGIEFRAIRQIISEKQDERVMFVRHDDADVEGVFSTDGYLSAKEFSAIEAARMIQDRLRIIRTQK